MISIKILSLLKHLNMLSKLELYKLSIQKSETGNSTLVLNYDENDWWGSKIISAMIVQAENLLYSEKKEKLEEARVLVEKNYTKSFIEEGLADIDEKLCLISVNQKNSVRPTLGSIFSRLNLKLKE
jgi:hypothetical protein